MSTQHLQSHCGQRFLRLSAPCLCSKKCTWLLLSALFSIVNSGVCPHQITSLDYMAATIALYFVTLHSRNINTSFFFSCTFDNEGCLAYWSTFCCSYSAATIVMVTIGVILTFHFSRANGTVTLAHAWLMAAIAIQNILINRKWKWQHNQFHSHFLNQRWRRPQNAETESEKVLFSTKYKDKKTLKYHVNIIVLDGGSVEKMFLGVFFVFRFHVFHFYKMSYLISVCIIDLSYCTF